MASKAVHRRNLGVQLTLKVNAQVNRWPLDRARPHWPKRA